VRIGILVLVVLSMAASPILAEQLTLSEGLRIVTEENNIVKIKQQDEKSAHTDTLVARSKLLPSINATYDQTFLKNQPGLRAGDLVAWSSERNFYTYQLAIQQIIYDFGNTISLYKSAKLLEDTKRLDTLKTMNDIALEFCRLYFDVLESDKMIAIAEKEVDSLASHAQVARNLLKGGVITKNDLLEAEVQLADGRQKLLNAQNTKRINEARVNNALNRPLTLPVGVAEVSGPRAGLPPYEGAAEKLESQRTELKIVDATIEAFKYEERAMKSEYLPKFILQGQYDYTENKYLVDESNVGITVQMNLNLWSGGSTKAEVQKMRIAQSRLRIERKKLTDDIGLEAKKYYLDAVNAMEAIKVAKGAISQAEENLRITKLKYVEGTGIARDVTDAIALRTLSETNYWRAVYEYCRAEAGYLHALGYNLKEEYGRL
jgi:outer membrane protein TolC